MKKAHEDNPPAKKRLISELKRTKLLFPYVQGNKKLLILPAVLIPLISVLQIAQPLLLRRAIDDGVIPKDMDSLFMYASMFLGVVVFSYLARTSQALASIVFIQRMITKMRVDLVRHVLRLKARYHDKNLSGALVTRATSDFDNLSESLNFGVLNTLVDVATLFGSIVAMMMLNWKLGLVTCAVLPLVIFAIQWFSRALKHNMLTTRKKIAHLNAYTQESIYGNTTIKLLNGEEAANEKHNQLNLSYRNSQMKVVFLDAFLFSVLDGISSVAIGLVLWTAVSGTIADETITAGVIVAFVGLVQQLFDPLKQLGSTMAMLQGVFTSIDRIFGILNEKQFVEGSKGSSLSGDISFEHVNFSYDKTEGSKILKDLSFEVKKGESLAIVGSTGSGKSTIIKLLSKLYDGYEGSIKIGPGELRDYTTETIRSNIAIVPQDIVLFDGSIEFNISLGASEVTLDDVKQAAKTVGADRFINRFSDGYDHNILERGANLSHGQRQLLAFARALCKNPDVVILDEATSSVDPASEREIQVALTKILEHKTVIIIAHRLSTIKECDKIIVLEKGKLIESGTHDALVKNEGRYFNLIHEFSKKTVEA